MDRPQTAPVAADRSLTENGPWLTSALICERVLIETDRVHSLIRLIDRTTVQTVGPEPPEEMPPFQRQLSLFVSFKTGGAPPPYSLKITRSTPAEPTAESDVIMDKNIELEAGRSGHNQTVNLTVVFSQPGVHWFNVYLQGALVTRMPIEVVYAYVKE